jgi:hypothetical protein
VCQIISGDKKRIIKKEKRHIAISEYKKAEVMVLQKEDIKNGMPVSVKISPVKKNISLYINFTAIGIQCGSATGEGVSAGIVKSMNKTGRTKTDRIFPVIMLFLSTSLVKSKINVFFSRSPEKTEDAI